VDQSALSAILQRAYSESAQFSPEERADVLLELSQTALGLDKSKSREWAIDLFRTSVTELSPGINRAAAEKNALVALASTDLAEAVRLFKQQDPPSNVDPTLHEDIRAYGSRTIFAGLWQRQGLQSLPTIEDMAVWLGSTGQYPYHAMANIIVSVSQKNSQKAAALFSEAVSFVRRDPGFLSTGQDLVYFISQTYRHVPASLTRDALSVALTNIEESDKKQKGKMHTEVQTKSGRAAFDSYAEVLIYQLLPIMDPVDPSMAADVRNRYTTLRNAPPPSAGMALTGSYSEDGSATPAQMTAASDEHKVLTVSRLNDQPQQAADIALSVRNPELRAVALASIAGSYSGQDPKTAEEWIRQCQSELHSMDDNINKLRLEVALTRSFLELKRESDAMDVTDRAFDLGEEIFNQDLRSNPGKETYSVVGFEELQNLTSLFTSKESQTLDQQIMSRIGEIRNPVLRVRLLISMVGSLEAQTKQGKT
jgi:hypothetical protein